MKNKTMKNKKLKTKMFEDGYTHKEVAECLGINTKVFTNKINRLVVNGYETKFTEAEKIALALKFGIDKNDIE